MIRRSMFVGAVVTVAVVLSAISRSNASSEPSAGTALMLSIEAQLGGAVTS
jgi:hypothetical protein